MSRVAPWRPTCCACWRPKGASCAGRREVVRHWLAAFGPGTLADLKWWTGWTLTDTRKAVAGSCPRSSTGWATSVRPCGGRAASSAAGHSARTAPWPGGC
ncbi:DNA glycosylase AlkZ-like family protein [Actinomycetota bacterium Odt1-20B]